MVEGAVNAKSTKSADIIKAMESQPFEGVTGEEVFRAEDHQLLKDYYVLIGKPAGERADEDDIMKVAYAGGEPMPVAETGCKLVPLGQ
jgi:branched-chain amino acid transport system substrate-binding protein